MKYLDQPSRSRGGYLGQLVVYPLETLEDPQDLREGWKLFEDNRHYQPATLPLKATGRHLETDVALPADWQGKDVYLEFEVADRWVGIVVMMNVISTKQGQTYRTFSSENRPLPEGTFGWQQRQLTFITDAYAQSAMFSFQLRWATGMIWYDDVELEDLGPVVPVDTY